MVMLSLFQKIRDRFDLALVVGHVNHQMREEATKDVEFLSDYCTAQNLELKVEMVNVPNAIEKTGESPEMGARRLRYEALEYLKSVTNADVIATAHTASDQAETVLLRILEGTGVKGLQGIREKRGDIIRPLLIFERNDIESYAQKHQIPYREDATNQDVSIKRNWIRHELFPQIQKHLNPNVQKAVYRLSVIQTETQQYLENVGVEAFNAAVIHRSQRQIILDLTRCQTYFTAILKTIFNNCLAELDTPASSLTFSQMEQLTQMAQTGDSGTRVELPGHLVVIKDREQMLFSIGEPWADFFKPFQLGELNFADSYRCRITETSEVNIDRVKSDPWTELFDKIELNHLAPAWRTWRAGDTISLPKGSTKKLSDVFIDTKTPVWEKHQLPLLVSKDDEVLWIPGKKRSAKAWIKNKTKSVIQISVTKNL